MSNSKGGVVQLFYLGSIPMEHLQDTSPGSGNITRSNEEKVIDHVETAQLMGNLPNDHKGCPKVHAQISKHGVKLIDVVDGRVVERIPLISCMMSLSYDDSNGRFNAIMVEKKRSCDEAEMAFECHLLQSIHQTETDHLCALLDGVFAESMRKTEILEYSPTN